MLTMIWWSFSVPFKIMIFGIMMVTDVERGVYWMREAVDGLGWFLLLIFVSGSKLGEKIYSRKDTCLHNHTWRITLIQDNKRCNIQHHTDTSHYHIKLPEIQGSCRNYIWEKRGKKSKQSCTVFKMQFIFRQQHLP